MPIAKPARLKRGGSPQTRTRPKARGHARHSYARDAAGVTRPGRGTKRAGSGQGKRKN